MLNDEIIALSAALERLALTEADKAPLFEILERMRSQVAALTPDSTPPDGLTNPYRLLIDLRDMPADDDQRYADATKVLQLRAVQLRTAAEISARIAEMRDPDELLAFVTMTLSKRFGFYHVSILLVDDDDQVLITRAVNSDEYRSLVTDRFVIHVGGPGMISWAAKHRQPCIASDVRTSPYYAPQSLVNRTRAEIALPLMARDRLLGVLNLESEVEEDFDEGEVQTLQSLANQISTALENARLFEAEQSQRRVADTLRDI